MSSTITREAPRGKVTAAALRSWKRPAHESIISLTAYDFPTARALDEAGVDLLLVGDSLGMVVLGYESTLPVTMEEMLHHTRAVARARPRALVVGDMPWMSYHAGIDEAIRNAGRFIKEAQADAIKLEGGIERVETIRAIVGAEVPVMGHIGLTPQSVLRFGGYRVQGRGADAARSLLEAAKQLEAAGCFALVLEGIPAAAAAAITKGVSIPTIGIGAGPDVDGQILVIHDLVGFGGDRVPRFVRRYADLASIVTEAARRFGDDVRSGDYPKSGETYSE